MRKYGQKTACRLSRKVPLLLKGISACSCDMVNLCQNSGTELEKLGKAVFKMLLHITHMIFHYL